MSLRWRVVGLILVSTLLPVLVVFWMLLDSRADTVGRAHQQLGQQLDSLAADLDNRISGTAQLLFGLGRVPVLATADPSACSAFLADVLKEHPQYTGLLTINPQGRLHCDSLQTGRELDLNDRGYFKRALRGERYAVEAAVGRLTGKGVLQIAHPVFDGENRLQYVLLASLNLDEFGRGSAGSLPYPRMSFYIWNDDGTVRLEFSGVDGHSQTAGVSDTERAFVLRGQQAAIDRLGQGEQARLWARSPLPRTANTGLRLALSVPEVDLMAQDNLRFRRLLTALLLLSAGLIGLALLLGEFALRRQASRLIDGIARLDQGHYDQPIGHPYPKGELGGVMAALDRMGQSLLAQQAQIQHNQAQLEHQANTDALTGLANRHLLEDRLTQALIHAQRTRRVVGVLLLDLDRFKNINDSLGHSQGDQLLREVARRLLACVREGDTVARLGGDEFVLVLTDVAQVSDLLGLAQQVLQALSGPVVLDSQTLDLAASLGMSCFPRDGRTVETLVQQADIAMYRAKEQGGHTVVFFQPEMNQRLQERMRTESGLHRALVGQELRLFYQPLVDLGSNRITGAEALVRWQDPERGLLPPGQFIGVAEDSGLIVAVGQWVLNEACRQIRAWMDAGLGPWPVAVNLSARQFNAPTLLEDIARALAASRCPPELLHLEITESMLIDQAEQALQTMHQLRAMGVQLSIDDFGTGYSSLSYLKQFPVGKLKIDRSFVADISHDPNDRVIVDTILTLARKLGLRTVAEGVETEDQRAQLLALGCQEFQGYLCSPPVPADAFVQLAQTHAQALNAP